MFFRKKDVNSDSVSADDRGFTEESRAEAIRNLCGNEAIYEKYLARFRESHSGSATEIRTLFEAGDFENARIQSHSLKGLAATLGLLPISQTAASLALVGVRNPEALRKAFRRNRKAMRPVHD